MRATLILVQSMTSILPKVIAVMYTCAWLSLATAAEAWLRNTQNQRLSLQELKIGQRHRPKLHLL